jgi:hypothetical protein
VAPEPARPRHCWARPLAAGAAWTVLAALAIALTGRDIHMDGPWFPEPEAAVFVKSHGLSGRMLTWFDYGEYAIWHFAPALRVSMDGRRETVYSERLRAIHQAAYAGGPKGVAAVRDMAPDYVWLPSTSPAVRSLATDGWHTIFKGTRSTILARAPIAPVLVATARTAPRAFPGP